MRTRGPAAAVITGAELGTVLCNLFTTLISAKTRDMPRMFPLIQMSLLEVPMSRWELDNENTWSQGGGHHTLGTVVG